MTSVSGKRRKKAPPAGEISGTARNPNSVAPIPFTVSNPPTQAELQAVVDKLNELIGSLQR